jgi:DNA invertase Pin-like site-specific DNA recombinase
MSGTTHRRPGRDKLMQDAKDGRFDCVIVSKLDRWGRSVIDVMETLEQLQGFGVRWIAVDQNLDTDRDNPVGRLLLQLLAAVAEFERSLIRERVKAGLAHAKANGTRSGKPIGGQETSIWDRQKAYDDRMAGASWQYLVTKYDVPQSTIRKGIVRYAKRMKLPLPPVGEEHVPNPALKAPTSGKPARAGGWPCEFCGHPHHSRAQMRQCCPEKRAERLAKLRDPLYMSEYVSKRKKQLKEERGQ